MEELRFLACIEPGRSPEAKLLDAVALGGVAMTRFGGRYRAIEYLLNAAYNGGASGVTLIDAGNNALLMEYIALSWRARGGTYFPKESLDVPTMFETAYKRTPTKFIAIVDGTVPFACNTQELQAKIEERPITIVEHEGKTTALILSRKAFFEMLERLPISSYDHNGIFAMTVRAAQSKFAKECVTITLESVFAPSYASPKDYLRANLDYIPYMQDFTGNFNNVYAAFVRTDAPVAILRHGAVIASVIADGGVIEGTVENSVIGPDVTVEKGAHIKNSIIIGGAIIGKDAVVENAIIGEFALPVDKRTKTIEDKARLSGTEERPVVINANCVVAKAAKISAGTIVDERGEKKKRATRGEKRV